MPQPAIIVVPPAPGNYGQAISVQPSDILITPNEGSFVIPLNIDWSGASGDVLNGATLVNLNNRQLRNFSGIRALFVDNSKSGADVTFLFPDMQFEFTVPAGKGGLYPVVAKSGCMSFYVVSAMALAGDLTFVQAFNYMPPPVDISRPTFQTAQGSNLVSLTATNNAQILPLGIGGTVQNLSVSHNGIQAAAGGISFQSIQIQDGAGQNLAFLAVQIPVSTYAPPAMLLSMNGLSVRFQNGIKVVVTNTGTAPTFGSASVSFAYRQP